MRQTFKPGQLSREEDAGVIGRQASSSEGRESLLVEYGE